MKFVEKQLKNEARKKCVIRDTRTSREEYIKIRNEARKICRDEKREMTNNQINPYPANVENRVSS